MEKGMRIIEQLPRVVPLAARVDGIYFKAFVEPTIFREWLGDELDLVLELNGKYCVTAKNAEPANGTIEIIAWPEQLVVTWPNARFDLHLSAGRPAQLGLAPEVLPH